MNVLVNTPLPALEGITVRHFGECGPLPIGFYSPEAERRPLGEILAGLPEGFNPDLLLIRCPEHFPIPDDLHVFPGPKALMITDWNICLRFLPDLCRLFDVCFTDEPGTRLLRHAGVLNVVSQSISGHNPEQAFHLGIPRDLDLSFCGNPNADFKVERSRLVFRLAHWGRKRAVHLGPASDANYFRILNRRKIVFNHSSCGEANMRLYEAMACGAVVLVEKGNVEVPKLFRDGEHYLAYDPATLETELDGWLAEPSRLAAIGEAARLAVAEHTQAKQIKRLVLRAAQGPWPRSKQGLDHPVEKARVKLRILAMGNNLAEAVREAEKRPQLPGLTGECLPALCLHLLETDLDSGIKNEIQKRLESCLADLEASKPMAACMRAHWAILEGRWEDALAYSKDFLNQLENIRKLSAGEDPGYGVLVPPLNLEMELNRDLNLSFRLYLLQGNHLAYADLLRNLALLCSATACLELGRLTEGMRHVVEMSSHHWRETPPWPLLFAYCLLGGNQALLEETVNSWLDDNPLDTSAWDRILQGLKSAERPDLIWKFQERILPAARHFLSAEKVAALSAIPS